MIPRGAALPRDTERPTVAPDGRPFEAQPKWRRDFPIARAIDEYVSRRDLVKFIVLTSGAFVVGQFWLAVKAALRGPPKRLPALAIARVDALPVGGAMTFRYPADSAPRLLVRTGTASFVAYDQQCTHLTCPVVPVFAERRLHCPCHHGWFDLETGRPLAGPPRRPLPRVLVEVRGDTVFATGVVEPFA